MSDLMLHGVLNMPPDIWGDDPISVQMRYSRYVQASEKIKELGEALRTLAAINPCWSEKVTKADRERIINLMTDAEQC